MDSRAQELVDSLKEICRREGLKVFEPRGGRCPKHLVTLERNGKSWLCWDCQLELATRASGSHTDQGARDISVEAAFNLFGPSYWKR